MTPSRASPAKSPLHRPWHSRSSAGSPPSLLLGTTVELPLSFMSSLSWRPPARPLDPGVPEPLNLTPATSGGQGRGEQVASRRSTARAVDADAASKPRRGRTPLRSRSPDPRSSPLGGSSSTPALLSSQELLVHTKNGAASNSRRNSKSPAERTRSSSSPPPGPALRSGEPQGTPLLSRNASAFWYQQQETSGYQNALAFLESSGVPCAAVPSAAGSTGAGSPTDTTAPSEQAQRVFYPSAAHSSQTRGSGAARLRSPSPDTRAVLARGLSRETLGVASAGFQQRFLTSSCPLISHQQDHAPAVAKRTNYYAFSKPRPGSPGRATRPEGLPVTEYGPPLFDHCRGFPTRPLIMPPYCLEVSPTQRGDRDRNKSPNAAATGQKPPTQRSSYYY